MTATSSTALARACTLFATTQCRGHSPLYEQLALALATEPDLLSLLSDAPRGQGRPTLLLAAVHHLLLGGVEHPLARFYPSVGSGPPPTGAAPELLPTFRSFCAAHRSSLLELIGTGHTQTNDVRRTAALVLALQEVQRHLDLPLALIDAGSSVGLNLLYERFRYRFGTVTIGDPEADVEVVVAVDDDVASTVTATVPGSVWRTGIDVAPVDLLDPAAVRWVRSFVWPELSEDADRLMAAMALARSSPPPVIAGDAVELLPGLLRALPDDVLPVVFHSTLLTYLTRHQRGRLFRALADAGVSRPLAWVALESPGLLVDAGGVDLGLPDSANAAFVLTVVIWVNGRRTTVPLARVDPYGRSIRSLS